MGKLHTPVFDPSPKQPFKGFMNQLYHFWKPFMKIQNNRIFCSASQAPHQSRHDVDVSRIYQIRSMLIDQMSYLPVKFKIKCRTMIVFGSYTALGVAGNPSIPDGDQSAHIFHRTPDPLDPLIEGIL